MEITEKTNGKYAFWISPLLIIFSFLFSCIIIYGHMKIFNIMVTFQMYKEFLFGALVLGQMF